MKPAEAIAGFVARHGARLEAEPAALAVSGGGDSVALAALWRETKLPAVLLHVNYGLRAADSDADEALVRRLGAEFGWEVRVYRVQPQGVAEEAMRNLRYNWFFAQPEAMILTAHTLEDQAETVLFRLFRGSGPAGLAGIRPVLEQRIYRPLLYTRREDLRQWLVDRGIVWREDRSNTDTAYRRNWIRHELLPGLREHLNPELDWRLAGLAEVVREDEEWLRVLVEDTLAGMVHRGGHGWVLDCTAWRSRPPGLQRRLLRALLEKEKGNLNEIEFGHIEAVMRLCTQAEGDGRLQVPGLDVMRSFDLMRVVRQETLAGLPVRNYRVELVIPGETEIPEGAGRLRATLREACHYNEDGESLDWDRLLAASEGGRHLSLRNWRPGDSLIRRNKEDAVKVKELFQKHRIPLWRRRSWPIVVVGDEPVWAGEFGPVCEYAAGPETRRRLHLEWIPALDT